MQKESNKGNFYRVENVMQNNNFQNKRLNPSIEEPYPMQLANQHQPNC